MSRSSARGQLSPFTALAAVLVLSMALSTYALALGNAPTPSHDRNRAGAVLTGALDTVRQHGVTNPAALDDAPPDTPLSVNLTLVTANRTWTVGPAVPPAADAASRRVSVRVGEGTVRPGRLRAAVWP